MVVGDRDHEVQLQVGPAQLGRRLDEGAAFRERRGDQARAVAAPLADGLQQVQPADRADAEHVGLLRLVGDDEVAVVLQVLAHAAQRMPHGDAVAREFDRVADARAHQQLRRVEGAATQRHLAARANGFDVAAAPHLDAHRAPVFEHHAQGLRAGQHREVGALVHHRVQVGRGGRAALAVLRAAVELRDLVEPRAFLLGAVEVVVARDAAFGGSAHEGLGDGARALLLRHLQRAVGAVQRAGAALVALGAQEVRQHLVEAPAGAA
ncbi:hypothetical protein D3C72_1521760 [compost metagenome]